MADYTWRCPACDAAVPAGATACAACGCPDGANGRTVDAHREAYANSDAVRAASDYRCPKCDHHRSVVGEFRAPGGGIASAFDVASVKFAYVSCQACGFTEFYRQDLSIGATVVDLLVG